MLSFEGNLIVDAGFMIAGAVVWHFIWKGALALLNALKTDLSALEARLKALETAVQGGAVPAAPAASAVPAAPATSAVPAHAVPAAAPGA